MTWGVHTTLVPQWFDPAENIQQTPFMVLAATHDALVKPMPGKAMAPASRSRGPCLRTGSSTSSSCARA